MKVCFVGSGSIGKRHMKNVKALSEEKAFPLTIHLLRATKRELPSDIHDIVSRVCYSVEELDDSYDAVFITNPTFLHYETLLGLKGKSPFFFVEKPVFDKWDVDLSVFEDSGAVFYVACPLRYTKVLKRAGEMIQNGLLMNHRILSVRAISSSYLPEWRPGTDYRETYSAHKDQGGGVKIDLIHEWDYLVHFFGFPNRIIQLCGKYSDLEMDCEDIAVYAAQYDDKLIELHLDYFGRQVRRACEVITTEDVYVFDIAGNSILKNGEIVENFVELPNDKYMEELRYFYRLMTEQINNVNDLKHAVDTMRVACEDW